MEYLTFLAENRLFFNFFLTDLLFYAAETSKKIVTIFTRVKKENNNIIFVVI